MLLFPPSSFRKPRGRVRRKPPAPAVALTLVSAELTFNAEDDAVLVLTFDRAIDVAGLDGSQITVDDAGGMGFAYAGTGVDSVPTPQSVVVALALTGSAEGDTVLNA